jgi:hypothetical protein
MSTNTSSNSLSSLSENDPSPSSTGLQNQPYVPGSSALPRTYKEGVVTANHARGDTSNLPHHLMSTTSHHQSDEIIILTTACSPVRHGDSVAESSEQRDIEFTSQEALTFSPPSAIASHPPLGSTSAAETFGPTETSLPNPQGGLADMRTVFHLCHLVESCHEC